MEPPKMGDQEYLLNDQYRDSSNLDARIQLHARFSVNKHGWMPWAFDRYDLPPHSRVLELGCGPGLLWLENIFRIPEGWDITLSDLSEGMVSEAKRNLGGTRREFRYEIIDAQAIPFEDGSLDAVIANHMLYHVPDRAKALSEIRRVLKPGGRLYTTTLGHQHLNELIELTGRFDADAALWAREWRAFWAETFNLENGAEELSRWFPNVEMYSYEDALVVAEAAPLATYILSTTARFALEGKEEEFTRFIEEQLAAHGPMRIKKDSGMFEAW